MNEADILKGASALAIGGGLYFLYDAFVKSRDVKKSLPDFGRLIINQIHYQEIDENVKYVDINELFAGLNIIDKFQFYNPDKANIDMDRLLPIINKLNYFTPTN